MGILTVIGVLRTLTAVGASAPAFKALFDQVVSTFREDEQDVLKRGYAEAMAKTDGLHDDVQEELSKAAKK